MSRTLTIPPVNAPGEASGSGRMEVRIELVDAAGTPVPYPDLANTLTVHGVGVYTVTDTPVEIPLSTQNELVDETFYRVTVRQGRAEFRREVQVPAGGDLTWAEFLNLQDPVAGGLAWTARLLPEGAAHGQVAAYDEQTGLWVPTSVAPMPAPLTNEGAFVETELRLPGAESGLWFSACVQIAQVLTITAGGGDTIRIASSVTADAGSIASNMVGSAVILHAINDTEWVALSSTGSWSF